MSRYAPDEYDLERSHELERRLDRDYEREPYRQRIRSSRGRSRYFSGLMFRPISSRVAVAQQTPMSYIGVREAAQGRIANGPALQPDEGSAGTRGGRGATYAESTGGTGVGAVPGVAA